MDYARAIKEINENAEFKIIENDLDNIEWLNETTPISVSDIQAKMAELPTAEEEATAKENKKASGKQKLKDLGLDDEEIKALIGA
jgi:hypothetical protein